MEYLYLVKGYRERGQVRQRVVARLGRADVVAQHLGGLLELLGPYLREPVGHLREVEAPQALTYGPVAVARGLLPPLSWLSCPGTRPVVRGPRRLQPLHDALHELL